MGGSAPVGRIDTFLLTGSPAWNFLLASSRQVH